MRKIKLYNRDGAEMYLEEIKKIDSNLSEWQIIVDSKHSYVLNYCRCIYENGFNSDIIAIDPSGGPFLSVGEQLDNFVILKINSAKSILLRERDSNN